MKTCDCNIVTKYYTPPKISDVHHTCTTVVRPVSVLSSHYLVSRFKRKFIITTSSEYLKI